MGLFQALYGIGMTLGPIMTGTLTARYNYCTAYLAIGGCTLAAAVLAPILLPRIEKNAGQSPRK